MVSKWSICQRGEQNASYRNARVGADAGAGDDDDLAGFPQGIGDLLQQEAAARLDVGGGHGGQASNGAASGVGVVGDAQRTAKTRLKGARKRTRAPK